MAYRVVQEKVILCLGDSITNGTGSSSVTTNSYPALLQLYLDEYVKELLKMSEASIMSRGHRKFPILSYHYQVVNLGVPGATISRNNSRTYWNTLDYQQALTYTPSAIIIGFGTNDAKTYCWNQVDYQTDYMDFIRNLSSIISHPKIYLLIPPPCYENLRYNIQKHLVNDVLPIVISDIASKSGAQTINTFDALGGKSLSKRDMFYNISEPHRKYNDGIHPNDIGYLELAHTIAGVLLGSDVAHRIRGKLRESNVIVNRLMVERHKD